MIYNQLSKAITRQPFRPFRIHTSDGAFHDVGHPDFCLVGVRTTLVHAAPADDPDGMEREVSIDNLHITRLEVLPATTNPTANGPSNP